MSISQIATTSACGCVTCPWKCELAAKPSSTIPTLTVSNSIPFFLMRGSTRFTFQSFHRFQFGLSPTSPTCFTFVSYDVMNGSTRLISNIVACMPAEISIDHEITCSKMDLYCPRKLQAMIEIIAFGFHI